MVFGVRWGSGKLCGKCERIMGSVDVVVVVELPQAPEDDHISARATCGRRSS